MPLSPPTIDSPEATPGLCYACVHRRALPNNRSACRHPATAHYHENQLAPLITAQGGALPLSGVAGLRVVGDPHAIEMGWFAWPFNFNAEWLVSCDGAEEP